MVHDLTADKDFQQNTDTYMFLQIVRQIEKINSKSDDLTSPEQEIVLTGTAYDRELKRYTLDCQSDHRNMCDCCGASINMKPWDFESVKTLCPQCDAWLEETQGMENPNNNALTVRIAKPWDIADSERENPIDNVLLWD